MTADPHHPADSPPPARGPRTVQSLLIALLAVASLGTTVLIVLLVYQRATTPALTGSVVADDLDIELPPFQLVDQRGEPFTRASLTGPPGTATVAAFIFTRCSGPCPRITSVMSGLQHDLPPGVRLVTFSVDPTHDTPPVLTEYARLAHAEPSKWTFVTGDRVAMWALIRDGFKLPVGESQDPDMPIFHTSRLVLIDHNAHARGLYEGLNEQGLADLRAALARVTGQEK